MELPQNYHDILDVWCQNSPKIGAKAEETIRYILKDIIHSNNGQKYHESPLTFTGSPFEPAFSFSSADVRYTIAPSPKEMKGAEKLDHTLAILKGLQINFKDQHLLDELRTIQSKGELSYGAQIGVRHTIEKDVFKLYVELPIEAREYSENLARRLLDTEPVLMDKDRNSYPTLFGINLENQEKEIYYYVENLHPLEIKTILSRANSVERFDDVLAFLNETQDTPIKHFLPGNTWGYSYSVNNKNIVTCSIYTFAKTLFGPDGWVRAGVLKMGQNKSWNTESYREISKALKNNRDTIHHGIFGVVLPHNRPAAAWVGISPIEPKYV